VNARRAAVAFFVASAFVAFAASSACGTAQNAAARDPMKCERDPACAKERGRYPDCTRQCADNPECVKRCEQIQQQVDRVGQP
jgi:hypothetical protein